MASLSRSDSVRTQRLNSDSFVAFDHAAAGHEGVRCTVSGSLIAKPCTPQEVAFYESSTLHPAFRDFMPTYIGTLSSADPQGPLELVAADAEKENGAVLVSESAQPPDSTTPEDVQASGIVLTQRPPHIPIPMIMPTTTPSGSAAEAETAWVPSNGKKLNTDLSIVLENIASGFRRPNVLDVKLGVRLWADDAPPAKRTKLDAVAKETTSGSLGFRIAGMKVWTGVNGETDEGGRTDPYDTKHEALEGGVGGKAVEKDGYRWYNKWYGRTFSPENVKEGFKTFLVGTKLGCVDRSKLMAKRLVDDLRRLQSVLKMEESRMYSSSVLIVYEGDPDAMEQALEEEQNRRQQELTRLPEHEEEDRDHDDSDGFDGFDLRPEGSFETVEINGLSAQAFTINLDDETAQLAGLDDEGDEEEECSPKVHDLRLIDFAHATWTPGQGPDENVLKGLQSLIRIFEEIAEE